MNKPLTKAQRQRKVAQQALWLVVDRYTGKILHACTSRTNARTQCKASPTRVIDRGDVRIKGVRA